MANLNFNKVMLGGRLSADPELKNTPSGISVTSFFIAVNRNYKGKNSEEATADFISCKAWRHTADFITKYFRKGSSIFVTGSLQTGNWTDKNGVKHYTTDLVIDEAYFVDAKGERTQAPPGGTYTPPVGTYIPEAYLTPPPDLQEIGEDEDLPF
jgi:single-strand DNA-binding protein